MDETHREFVRLVNQLASEPGETFASLFDTFIQHCQQHFDQEELLMRESSFSAYAEHRDEHQRILGELAQFRKRVARGLVEFGRNYIRERMPEWFRLHAATMDSALAVHLNTNKSDSWANRVTQAMTNQSLP